MYNKIQTDNKYLEQLNHKQIGLKILKQFLNNFQTINKEKYKQIVCQIYFSSLIGNLKNFFLQEKLAITKSHLINLKKTLQENETFMHF